MNVEITLEISFFTYIFHDYNDGCTWYSGEGKPIFKWAIALDYHVENEKSLKT